MPELDTIFKWVKGFSLVSLSAPPEMLRRFNETWRQLMDLVAPIWAGEIDDWHRLEERCRHIGVLVAGLLLSVAVWRKDAVSVPERCPVCRRKLKARWLYRGLKTTCGIVPVWRREARCRCKYYPRQRPADTALGLPSHDKVSPALCAWASRVGASLPYPITAQFFKDWLGQDTLSAKGVLELVSRVGAKLSPHPSVMPATTPGKPPDRVVVDGDGALVAIHHTAKRKAEQTHFELWVGRVYERHERDYTGGHTYRHLAFAGGCARAGDDIPSIFHALVNRRFPNAITERPIFVRGDGAQTVDTIAKQFPNAKRLLDQYHTLVKISERVREAFPSLKFKERKELADPLCEHLRRGDAQALLEQCDQLKSHPDIQTPEPLDRLANHIGKHKDHIWYPEAIALGIGVGTGISEKDVDLLLDRRFELRGMSWSPKGANNNLRVRITLFNQTPESLNAATR